MKINLWRFVILAATDEQDPDTWPRPLLGVGWFSTWFHSLKIYRSTKTLKFGPSANLYIFFGDKYLTLSIEYWIPKDEK